MIFVASLLCVHTFLRHDEFILLCLFSAFGTSWITFYVINIFFAPNVRSHFRASTFESIEWIFLSILLGIFKSVNDLLSCKLCAFQSLYKHKFYMNDLGENYFRAFYRFWCQGFCARARKPFLWIKRVIKLKTMQRKSVSGVKFRG